MGKLLDEVKAYFASASKEQLRKDWEELKEYNEFGPIALSVLDNANSLRKTVIKESACDKNNKYDSEDNNMSLAA